jgi:hypothetical protein
MDMTFNSRTLESLPHAHALARDYNSRVISPLSAITAVVSDSTTEITTEVRRHGPRH